ncbi:MAG: valine--tRNA ligase [Aeriscardovia sp.]|nr:valine--tRNA ligase [Aeriscardovia sp.]
MSEEGNKEQPERAKTVDGLDKKWTKWWSEKEVYKYRGKDRASTYSIDTPPPTVSGHLHVGHVFSYTHTDVMARYKRMRGFDVFYPMGWDDNGLPTERRVQNYYGVYVDTSLKFDPSFLPPLEGGKAPKDFKAAPCSRENFIKLCENLSRKDEEQFKDLWVQLGLSVDWSMTYNTIGRECRRISQLAFLENLKRGEAYQKVAPVLWDTTFQTAVSQAELESREYPGFYHKLLFHADGEDVAIETTRPELLAACVALIANPKDPRYLHLKGKSVKTPLFGVEVPVLFHEAAQMDKGAGIAMCCTFGDATDVEWWREMSLPVRPILTKAGRISSQVPDWIQTQKGKEAFEKLENLTAFSARKEIASLLKESGEMEGEPVPTSRMANFYEKGSKPIEILPSRQWYIINGSHDEKLRSDLLECGEKLSFHPAFMKRRYDNWVEGLSEDWLISRQRFFGVPFPIWYRVKENGETDYLSPILPCEEDLPVDPSSSVPRGFKEEMRGKSGGFAAEPDVMDTWAGSSLTPLLASGWKRDGELFEKTFPMDLRPQGQDIIRTWLFDTVLRSWLEFKKLPWKEAALSGWILDPDHKKMSKSKGNVVVPKEPIETYGPDAVRYWASSARLGVDTAYDEGEMKIGRRLANKILNASKFILDLKGSEAELSKVDSPLDLSLLSSLSEIEKRATCAMESFDHASALHETEAFFWSFCDDYIELVKDRAYKGDESALNALRLSLDSLLSLFAPFLPFVTEEAWHWAHPEGLSIHLSSWLRPLETSQSSEGFKKAALFLSLLRKEKSEKKVSLKTEVKKAVVFGPGSDEARIASNDLKAAVHALKIEFDPAAPETGVRIEF